jgi:hypothetical protein
VLGIAPCLDASAVNVQMAPPTSGCGARLAEIVGSNCPGRGGTSVSTIPTVSLGEIYGIFGDWLVQPTFVSKPSPMIERYGLLVSAGEVNKR